MNTEIPHLKIERLANGCIRLENESMGDSYAVDIHPLHVRLMGEELGMLSDQQAPASEAILREQIGQRDKELGRRKRDLLRLREKATDVQKAIANGDWSHADLSFEMGQANALVDLCDMAVDDFADDFEGRESAKLAPGVLWEGSNGGRQIDPGSAAGCVKETQREACGSSGATTDWALRQPLDKSSTKFVLFAMAWKAGGIGRCCASTAELAEMTGQDRKTVLENVKRLSEIGLIVDTGEKGGATKAVPIFRMVTDLEYAGPKTEQLDLEATT